MGRTACVIGAGFGGLAAAIRLQAMGVQTLLLEARDKPGGRAYVYEQDGFTSDAGPTVITAPHTLEELWELAGRDLKDDVQLLPVDPFYRLEWSDGSRLDYTGDDRLLKQIERLNPADVQGYLRFLEYSRKCFVAGYEERVSTAFLRVRDMLSAAPALLRVGAQRSVYDVVSHYVQDERLRQALSFHALLIGGNPMDISALYTLIHFLERKWGVWFARGGTGALVRAMADLFVSLGGTLRLSAPVTRVDVARVGERHVHRVHTADGVDEVDLVVSNADLHHTYGVLYDGAGGRSMRRRLERMQWSMSLFVLYFGTDRTWDDLAHHTVVFGPRYQGLLDDIFHGGTLPPDWSLYLHAPTRTDPSLAPPGHEACYVLSPVPHLGLAPLDWGAIAEDYADRILASLERLMPDLRQHVVTRRWMTPKDFQRSLGAYHGSAFSVSPLLQQSAWMRPHNRDPRIPGLYIVGAGTHPGAGVPGVIASAKATAGVIARDLGIG